MPAASPGGGLRCTAAAALATNDTCAVAFAERFLELLPFAGGEPIGERVCVRDIDGNDAGIPLRDERPKQFPLLRTERFGGAAARAGSGDGSGRVAHDVVEPALRGATD